MCLILALLLNLLFWFQLNLLFNFFSDCITRSRQQAITEHECRREVFPLWIWGLWEAVHHRPPPQGLHGWPQGARVDVLSFVSMFWTITFLTGSWAFPHWRQTVHLWLSWLREEVCHRSDVMCDHMILNNTWSNIGVIVVLGHFRVRTEEPLTHAHGGEAIQMPRAELLQVLQNIWRPSEAHTDSHRYAGKSWKFNQSAQTKK